MTPYDFSNLKFILALDEETQKKWWSSLNEDDRMYALALIETYRYEIIDCFTDLLPDFKLANNVINQIKGTKNV